MDADKLLAAIPEVGNANRVRQWVSDGLAILAAAPLDVGSALDCMSIALTPADATDAMLGAYGSSRWQRFASAVFLADWACYSRVADRADFDRLLYVLACFPVGFRLWMCRLPGGNWMPVGYTGWYPISDRVFDVLYTCTGAQ
jgi:hypothetical protein